MTLPEHEVLGVLKDAGGRRVFETRWRGLHTVTRVLVGAPVDPGIDGLVRAHVRDGRGSLAGVDARVRDTLEGYRAALRLPHPDPRWPQALDAGVTAEGYVWITSRWMPGEPLHRVTLPDDAARMSVALDILDILVRMHERLVCFGDLKPQNLVVSPVGDVAAIDLDTLREVQRADGWVHTTDYTPEWAAPEQHGRRTFLTSDVHAWARLTRHLLGAGVPDEWRPMLAACGAQDPLRRPTARTLADALLGAREVMLDPLDRAIAPIHAEPAPHGGGADATERVPDATTATADPTVRVTLDPGPPRADAPRAVRALPSTFLGLLQGCAAIVSIGLLLGITTVGGALGYCARRATDAANAEAEATMTALREHKTRKELNGRTGEERRRIRAELRSRADAAWAEAHTPRSGAVRALTTAWASGWFDEGATWSQTRFEADTAIVQQAPDPDEPEARLAAATLDAAACRLAPSSVDLAARCARAESGLRGFFTALPPDEAHHWLRVEATWIQVLLLLHLAERDAALPTRDAHLSTASDACERADAWRAWAPVNGPELVEDCLVVAGRREDPTRYARWGRELAVADGADLRRATLERLHRSAGESCGPVKVSGKRRPYTIAGPYWCLAMGELARGCHGRARANATAGSVFEPAHDWSALYAALGPDDAGCLD